MQTFLRTNPFVSYVMVAVRFGLGYIWLMNAWNKLSGNFDIAPLLSVMVQQGKMPGWWRSFLEYIVIPNASLFNILVTYGELLVGTALILGLFTTFAGYMAMFMNFSFLFTFSAMLDAQLLFVTFLLILAGSNAGKIGLDRFMPAMKERLKQKWRYGH